MIPLFLARNWKLIGIGLIVALAIAWIARIDHLRAHYKQALSILAEQAQTVLIRTRDASENPKLTWDLVPGQIVALGESNKQLKGSLEAQTLAVDQWAKEAADRQAEAAEWKRIADKAQAQRQSVLRRLSQSALTPGTRDDCMALLREAEDALDLAREEGGV